MEKHHTKQVERATSLDQRIQELFIYTKYGKRAYYRVGDDIYDVGGTRAFWVSDMWWLSHMGGAKYYENGGWVYRKGSEAAFYYAT